MSTPDLDEITRKLKDVTLSDPIPKVKPMGQEDSKEGTYWSNATGPGDTIWIVDPKLELPFKRTRTRMCILVDWCFKKETSE